VKWVAFIGALLFLVPWLGARAAASAKIRGYIVTALAFDLFNPAHVNFFSDEHYRGDSRGFEVTSVDLLVLTLAIAQRQRGANPAKTHRFFIPRMLYLTAAVLSAAFGHDPFRSAFSIWKILRMFGYFSVLAGAFQDLALANAALQGLAYGVVSQGAMVLWQKYVYRMVRVVGSQPHPNSLAMLVNFISPVALSLLLHRGNRRLTMAVCGLAAFSDVCTLSRGGMVMYLLATVVVVAFSLWRGSNPYKLKVVTYMVIVGVAGVGKSIDTIIKRFTEAPKESELARKLFNMAARAMAEDYPFGVGINMYSYVLDHNGYADRFGVDPGDRTGIAHHIYWLTAAETGYFGAGCYILVLASVIVSAVRLVKERGVQGEIAVGIMAGLVVTYMQGTAEWIARQTPMSYCFWLFAAMISAFLAVRARSLNAG
jgi:O-Antigen ligase